MTGFTSARLAMVAVGLVAAVVLTEVFGAVLIAVGADPARAVAVERVNVDKALPCLAFEPLVDV